MPNSLFQLNGTVGRTWNVNSDDTLRTKQALRRIGYFKTPDYGLTDSPDDAMFSAIEAFQRANKLAVDGVMRPDGPTAVRLAQALDAAKPATNATGQVAQSALADSEVTSSGPSKRGSSPTENSADLTVDAPFGMVKWKRTFDKDTNTYVYIHKPTGDELPLPADAHDSWPEDEIKTTLELADEDPSAFWRFISRISSWINRAKPEDLLLNKYTYTGLRG